MSPALPEEPLPRVIAGRDAGRLRGYREYLEYYEGRRGGAPVRGRERALTFNYARALVEKGASYLVTEHRPLVTVSEDTPAARRQAAEAERALFDVWETNDLARLDLETEVDTAVLGDGAFKVVWDERERRVVVSAPDVQGLYAWWAGDDVRRLWRVAARYRVDGEQAAERLGHAPRRIGGRTPDSIEVVEAWTAERFELWIEGTAVEERPNPYGEIPFVIFPNIPRPKQFWGVSDIEPLREPLAELNRALTQLSRILELSGNPIAVLENVEEARDIAVQPGAVWEVPEQARAYLLDLLQGGGVRLHVDYVDLVYRTLHDLAETPRIAFGDGHGDRSGVALQTELDPLLRKVARKRLIRSAALRRRNRLILRVLGHHTGQRLEDGVRTDIAWGPVFPRDPGLLVTRAHGLAGQSAHKRTHARPVGCGDGVRSRRRCQMQEQRRLTRDRDGRMLGGVCAGIAKHYDYDVTVVRIIFVLLAFLSGFGVIAYLVMWLLLPLGPRSEAPRRQMMRDNVEEMTERARLAAESARAAAEAARQAADQLAEATRSAVTAARDTWQQGSQQQTSEGQGSEQGSQQQGSEAADADDVESESSGKPGATTPDGSQSTWPPDRELPATDEQPPSGSGGAGSSEETPGRP